MHFAKVIGTVVCTTKVAPLVGQRFLLLQPVDEAGTASGRPLVAVDCTSAGPGQTVFYVRAREAATALPDPFNPADAAITGIVDRIQRYPDAGVA